MDFCIKMIKNKTFILAKGDEILPNSISLTINSSQDAEKKFDQIVSNYLSQVDKTEPINKFEATIDINTKEVPVTNSYRIPPCLSENYFEILEEMFYNDIIQESDSP